MLYSVRYTQIEDDTIKPITYAVDKSRKGGFRMTIKEIEERSGMPRANIRFYEQEGLLAPRRLENRYRDYSETDLEVLRRIKLLRTLHISIEEIKALHTGQKELSDTLSQQLVKLQREKSHIEQSQNICRIMQKDGARYQTLNAQHYLDALKDTTPLSVIGTDIIPEVRIPWRRFFARSLDYVIYMVLWNMALALLFNVNIGTRSTAENLLYDVVAGLMMLLIEPVLISVFGTTIGKWILGLHVTDEEGGHLCYKDSLTRTWEVFLHGMGLNLPVYQLIRLWKSYRGCSDGGTLSWEYNSTLVLKDERDWRTFACIGMHVALFFLLLLTVIIAEQPKHHGDITVAEFCENYNRLSDYYELHTDRHLDAQGSWVEEEHYGSVVIQVFEYEVPEYSFSETDGIMTGMQFTVEIENGDGWICSYQTERLLSILSFVKAQKINLFSNEIKAVTKQLSEAPFESFDVTIYGVRITCDIECSGYGDFQSLERSDLYWPTEGAEARYFIHFSMQKDKN